MHNWVHVLQQKRAILTPAISENKYKGRSEDIVTDRCIYFDKCDLFLIINISQYTSHCLVGDFIKARSDNMSLPQEHTSMQLGI